jgi:hypothetical protein
MIKITESTKHSRCEACFSDKDVKAIEISRGGSVCSCITLCKGCRWILCEKLNDEWEEEK